MATATAEYITSIDEGGQPTAGFRITGGTDSDRVTLADVVAGVNAEAALHSLTDALAYDEKTGTLTRAEASPTSYQFIFGSATARSTVTAGSTASVLELADATGFATTGRVRVDGDEEREVTGINGNAVTLDTALSSVPSNGDAVLYLEAIDSIVYDCFLSLVGETFNLYSEAGTDSSAQDLGNDTDKIVFGDRCDAVIGAEFGDGDAPDAGNVRYIVENISINFFTFFPIFSEQAKITCNAYLVFIGKGNVRVNMVNRNTDSVIRMVLVEHGVHPFADNVGVNFDLDVASQRFYAYVDLISFRDNTTPGGIQSNLFEISEGVIRADHESLRFFFLGLDGDLLDFTIRGLSKVSQVGETDQPRVALQWANTSRNLRVILDRYGAKRGDEYFALSNNNGQLRVEVRQRASFAMQDPSGTAVSCDLKVESGSYTVAFGAGDTLPTVAVTDYGNEQEFAGVSSQDVDVLTKIMAGPPAGNQNRRNVDETATISSDLLTPSRYSAWAWGKQIIYRQAFTLADEVGETDIAVTFIADDLVTSASLADVPASAATYDDLYDLLVEYAFDNEEDVAGIGNRWGADLHRRGRRARQ